MSFSNFRIKNIVFTAGIVTLFTKNLSQWLSFQSHIRLKKIRLRLGRRNFSKPAKKLLFLLKDTNFWWFLIRAIMPTNVMRRDTFSLCTTNNRKISVIETVSFKCEQYQRKCVFHLMLFIVKPIRTKCSIHKDLYFVLVYRQEEGDSNFSGIL